MQEEQRSAVMGGLSKPKGGGKKSAAKTHSIHIRRADGGGFIAKHELMGKDGETGTAEHILPNMDALQGHVQQAMGDQPESGMAAGGAGMPPSAAGGMPGEE